MNKKALGASGVLRSIPNLPTDGLRHHTLRAVPGISSIIAVDPGKSGAVVFIPLFPETAAQADCLAAAEVMRDFKTYREIGEAVALAEGLAAAHATHVDMLSRPLRVVEAVGPRPNEGRVSVFTFGASYGAALGRFEGDFHLVYPATWVAWAQRVAPCRGRRWDSREALLTQLSAKSKWHRLLVRKKDHNTSDAVWIGAFGYEAWVASRFSLGSPDPFAPSPEPAPGQRAGRRKGRRTGSGRRK